MADHAVAPPHYTIYKEFLSPASRRRGLKPITPEQCKKFAENVAEGLKADGAGPGWLRKLAESLDDSHPENQRIREALMLVA